MLDNEQFIELEPTDVWNQYQKCIDYMRTKGIFAGTEQNENFFHGKQWENAKLGDMKPIVINIIINAWPFSFVSRCLVPIT